MAWVVAEWVAVESDFPVAVTRVVEAIRVAAIQAAEEAIRAAEVIREGVVIPVAARADIPTTRAGQLR